MFVAPISQAYVAKLVPAATGHVVASFCSFDEEATLRAAFPVLEIGLKVFIARADMLR